MKKTTILLVITLVCLAVACGYAIGKFLSASGDQSASTSCLNTMANVIQSAQGDVYAPSDQTYIEPKSYYLVTYSVNGDQITDPVFDSIPSDLKKEQKNSALQKEAWQDFTSLIPSENRQMVSQYIVFTDGFENTLAAVDQTKNDPARWIMEVDIADLKNKDELMFTLIHEYAHLLTLNSSQGIPDKEILKDQNNRALLESKAAACPNYFTGIGCSLPNSYVNAFYQRFWLDINSEWKKIDALQYSKDLNPYYAGLYHFYKSHPNQFVDDYATTHPTEDIAESFAYFVFSPRPSGDSIKDQKIAFFYVYPELVALRTNILNGACNTK